MAASGEVGGAEISKLGTAEVVQSGQARGVELRGSRIDYLLTAKHSKGCSLFAADLAPGFDTGAHYHTRIEEFFYMLEGELELRCGDRVIEATPGTFVFVPVGTPHGIANRGSQRARMLLGCLPAGHENYFDELAALLARGGAPDPVAIGALRSRYDTIQLSGLQAK
jgi:mannose-6-phosphate isomerase-like protein (cupin superfamily)